MSRYHCKIQDKKLDELVNTILPAQEERIVARTAQLMEDKGIAANHCTLQQMKQMFAEERTAVTAQLSSLEERLCTGGVIMPSSLTRNEPTTNNTGSRINLYGNWEWKHANGKWYAIPENHKYPLPRCGIESLISQYYHGRLLMGEESGKRIRPAKLLVNEDLPPSSKKTATTNTCRARQRMSEAQNFMKFLENNIKRNTVDASTRGYAIPPHQRDILAMATHVMVILKHCLVSPTPNTRTRNTNGQVGWITHLKHVRKWIRTTGVGGRGALAKTIVDIDLDA